MSHTALFRPQLTVVEPKLAFSVHRRIQDHCIYVLLLASVDQLCSDERGLPLFLVRAHGSSVIVFSERAIYFLP